MKRGLVRKSGKDIVGKTMQELVDEGIYRDSCTLRVLKSGEKETLLQYDETGDTHYRNTIHQRR